MGEDTTANERTALSAGLIVYGALTESEEVTGMVTKVFPIVTSKAVLPYVAYRRVSLHQQAVKGYRTGAETAVYEVACFAARYEDSITLAEHVRKAMEGCAGVALEGVQVRSAMMQDSAESWENDAYVQTLVFELKVGQLF